MAGLVPAIRSERQCINWSDARHKAGHDERSVSCPRAASRLTAIVIWLERQPHRRFALGR
jgi:hypothetical protein